MTLRPLLLASGLLAFGAYAAAKGPLRYTVYAEPANASASFGRDQPLIRAFHSAAEFASFWPSDSGCPRDCARRLISGIDFSRNTLLVIALGANDQTLTQVSVAAVVDIGDHIEVEVLEHRYAPSSGEDLCNVTLTMPRPAVAVLIPQTDKPIHFLRKRALIGCEPPEGVN